MATPSASNPRRIPHIQIIGSINIDVVINTPRVPDAGETITASSFANHPGGKGANQAVACARASRNKPKDDASLSEATQDEIVSVSMVGTVGNDTYAELLVSSLKRNGVRCDHVSNIETSTGVSTILVEEKTGQNRILFTPGANSHMTPDLVPSLSKSPKPDLIVMQLETPLDTVLEIIRRAKKEGIDVLLNPAPAVKLPDEVLSGLTHLILNETEAAIMCDLEAPEESADISSFLGKAFASLIARGVRCPVITLGSKGVAYIPPGSASSWQVINAHKVPKVVDTTAAGDTFVGYYAVGLVQAKQRGASHAANWDPAEAVAYANRAAAQTVTKPGAMESIPFKDELNIAE